MLVKQFEFSKICDLLWASEKYCIFVSGPNLYIYRTTGELVKKITINAICWLDILNEEKFILKLRNAQYKIMCFDSDESVILYSKSSRSLQVSQCHRFFLSEDKNYIFDVKEDLYNCSLFCLNLFNNQKRDILNVNETFGVYRSTLENFVQFNNQLGVLIVNCQKEKSSEYSYKGIILINPFSGEIQHKVLVFPDKKIRCIYKIDTIIYLLYLESIQGKSYICNFDLFIGKRTIITTVPNSNSFIQNMVITKNGKLLLVCFSEIVYLIDMNTGNIVQEFSGDNFRFANFSNDDKKVLIGTAKYGLVYEIKSLVN